MVSTPRASWTFNYEHIVNVADKAEVAREAPGKGVSVESSDLMPPTTGQSEDTSAQSPSEVP